MAFSVKDIVQGGLRGGFPDLMARLDEQGQRALENLMRDAQMLSMKQRDDLAAAEGARRAEAWGVMNEAQKAGTLQKGSRSTKAEPTKSESAVTGAKAYAAVIKAREEAGGEDLTGAGRKVFDDALSTILAEHGTPAAEEPVKVDAVTGSFPTMGSPNAQAGGMLKPTSDFVGPPKLFSGGGGGEFRGRGAQGSWQATPRTDNKSLLAGPASNIYPQVPAPKTFDQLGIGDAQTQQAFSQLEAKVPGLREMFASDPESFQQLFAAVNSGKITMQRAIELITQSR